MEFSKLIINKKQEETPEFTEQIVKDHFGYLVEEFSKLDKDCQEFKTFDTILNLGRAIASSKDPEAVIAAFDRDPNFHRAFNANGKYALENIRAYLQVSNENMVGDFWRYCNTCDNKLERIRNRLVKSDIKENYSERRAYSLCDYSQFPKALDRIQKIYDVLVKFASDTSTVTEEQLYKELEAAGCKWTVNGKGEKVTAETIGDPTDPSMAQYAVIAGVLTEIFGTGVSAVLGNGLAAPAAASVGTTVGAIAGLGGWLLMAVAYGLYHKNNKPIGQRGWNADTLEKAVDMMVKFIDKNKKIKLPKELGFFRSLFNKERRHKRKIFKLVSSALGTSMHILATGLWEAVM